MYQRFVKRALDVVITVTGLIVLSPLFVVLAVLIKLDSRGPVLFRQKRVGKNKVLFEILKFRTMRIDTPRDVPTHQLNQSVSYITRVGRVLRKTSLDELPQLVNILLGQMSIIGPRPALWNQDDLIAYRDLYGANDVLPGLSGWAQVNGRDELAIDKKALRDGEYAQNISFGLDVKCFVLTIVKVFNADGIAEGREGKHYAAKRTEEEP